MGRPPEIRTISQPVTGDVIRPEDVLRPVEFLKQYPNIFASYHALSWVLRHRDRNGLLEAGAVMEIRAWPGSKSVKLLIDPARLIEWARGQQPRGR